MYLNQIKHVWTLVQHIKVSHQMAQETQKDVLNALIHVKSVHKTIWKET